VLSLALITSLATQFIDGARASKPDKPEVHVFLPDGYCGEFVVFWGENTPPVDEPPEFLSYNIYPTHPNAVVINLPEPYERAGLRFIYSGQDGELGRNPVFKFALHGGVGTGEGFEILEDGTRRSWTIPSMFVDFDVFDVGTTQACEVGADLREVDFSDLYFRLSGTEYLRIEK
ncbi:hypothetical protein, partial [Tritonibacter multivorans]